MVSNPYRLSGFSPSSAFQVARRVCWNQRRDETGRMLSGLLQAEELNPTLHHALARAFGLVLPSTDRTSDISDLADQRFWYPGIQAPRIGLQCPGLMPLTQQSNSGPACGSRPDMRRFPPGIRFMDARPNTLNSRIHRFSRFGCGISGFTRNASRLVTVSGGV
jgi:hypothetical protein